MHHTTLTVHLQNCTQLNAHYMNKLLTLKILVLQWSSHTTFVHIGIPLKVSICWKWIQENQQSLKYEFVLDLKEKWISCSSTDYRHILCSSYHSAHSSRFLHPECLHHLEDIHHSLSLASLNGSGYGTEHATAAHCITAGETHTDRCIETLLLLIMATAYLQCMTMGWLPVLLWTLDTSSITSITTFKLEQLPSGAQLVMWNWLTWYASSNCKKIFSHIPPQHELWTDLGVLNT